jgi:uncharacterized protein (TIGR02147 family)
MKPKEMPNIFAYTNYRKFLRDFFLYKQRLNRNFSYRLYSKMAGLSSPSALKEVIDGKKGLTISSIPKFILPFKLTKIQAQFFENLVLFNQASDEGEKSRYFREMIRIQRQPRSRTIAPQQYSFYDSWFNGVIREIITLKDFRPDPAWIAAKVKPQITKQQAKAALTLLKQLGLIKQEPNGKLAQDTPKLDIEPDVSVQAIRNFNRSMIELGWEAIERFAPKDREVSGTTLSMSRDCYEDVKEMVRKFKDDLLNYVCNHPGASDIVCQLNFQLFPLIEEDGTKH